MSSNNFNKEYYDTIWGSVHRHDYCETLADNLIATYGKVRFLDIGTGCGYLVKALRARDAKAYGIDVSEYAVAHSHGNVLLGDVRELPFKDNSFDVVHSQGLWEYIPESDIQRAYSECLRVGKHQQHNIDVKDSGIAEDGFTTAQSRDWWDGRLKAPKVLVACPNHIIKEYSFQRWIDNVKNLTYSNYDILVVDNSPDGELKGKYGDQIPIKVLDTTGIEDLMVTRINRSMEVIRQHFLKGDYAYWMNIESDVIPQKDVIEILMNYKGDWISHAYPARDGQDILAQQGIGCSLLSRRLVKRFDFKDAEDHTTPDGWLWDRVRPFATQYPTTELWGYLDVEHLAS